MSYRLNGPWRYHDDIGNVGLEVCDLIDHRGNVFPEGAWRVLQAGSVVKKFKGETAWSDAERLANDLYYEWRLNQ